LLKHCPVVNLNPRIISGIPRAMTLTRPSNSCPYLLNFLHRWLLMDFS
jgi:hypothetical protein